MKARTHYLKGLKQRKRKRFTHEEKAAWVMARLEEKWQLAKRTTNPPSRPTICAVDEEDQEAWEAAFGGKVIIYTIGPSVSPGFARTLRRMWEDGDLSRIVGGNQYARYYCQKTYYIAYTFKTWPIKE
jgi:hypothetical protein